MQDEFDAIVVGGGIIGRVTAWYLGKSGKHTLLLEQHDLEIPQGSSRGFSRAFGEAFADDLYYQLARQSRYFWQDLEREIGQKLLHLNGGVDISTGGDIRGDVNAIVAKLESRGSSFELLNGTDLCRRYPQWKCDPRVGAIYSPDTGLLEADHCMRSVILSAQRCKVETQGKSQVTNIELSQSGTVLVKTISGETYRTQKLVIAAGPWASNILAQLGVTLPLRVSQEQIVYFTPLHPDFFKPDNFPIWEWDGSDFVYGFPMFEKKGIKIAFHRDKHFLESLKEFSHTPSTSVVERLRSFINEHLPDAAGEAFDAMTCLYTNTPDYHFVIDTIPGFPQIAYFAGCNGHAFSCAPAIGKTLTELLYEGKTSIDISRFSANRFKT